MKFLKNTTKLLAILTLLGSFSLASLAPTTSYAQGGPDSSQHNKQDAKEKTAKEKAAKKKAADKKRRAKQASKPTTKTVRTAKPIRFTAQQQSDPTLAQGQTRLVQAGHNGTETLTYKVTTKNGKQTKKTLVSRSVTKAAVPQITAIGTYVVVAPNPTPLANSYTNVDGNQIESPDASPSGATGVCRDSTYTHAVHHQGACSSHGGVDHWL